MDFIKMQQDELAARKARRKKAAQRNKFTKLPIKTQLINSIKAGKLPKETPQEYVNRLWQERQAHHISLEHVWKCKTREKILVRIHKLDSKIAEIISARNLKHPGV